jgi:hypothetical protein
MRGKTNVLFSLVNQAQKNGIDPGAFAHPSWGIWSRDSGMESANPYTPSWDICEYTGSRSFPGYVFSGADLWYVINGWPDRPNEWGGSHKASLLVEPIGVNEVPSGSRIVDPEAYFRMGASAAAFGAGAFAHAEDAIWGRVMGPTQKRACVRMWQGALAIEAVS